MIKYKIDILLMQQTWQTTSSHFQENTQPPPLNFLIFHSASNKDKHAGVGFIISPKLRPFIMNFTSHSSSIASIKLRSQPRPIQLFSIYAPSMLSDSVLDLQRKEEFWQQAHNIIEQTPSAIIKIIAGDLNVRMHS